MSSLSLATRPFLLLAATCLVACSSATAPEAQSTSRASSHSTSRTTSHSSSHSTSRASLGSVGDWCRDAMHPQQNRAKTCSVSEMTTTLPASGVIVFEAGPNGDVHVESWDRDDVRVQSRVVASARTKAEAQRLADGTEITMDRGVLRQKSPQTGRSESVSVSYKVFTPRRTSVELSTTNGDVTLRGLTGAVRAQSTNGDVELYNVAAPIHARSTNGDIVVEYARRSANRSTIDIETANGDIDLRLPSGFAADIDAASRNGEISARGLTVKRSRYQSGPRGESVSGEIGGGGERLRAMTSNGDITIRVAR